LNAAAFVDSLSVARLLIQRKAEVDIMESSGKHALHHASMNGNAELVRLLLQSGADIETQDSAGGNAMHIACFFLVTYLQ
jgi:ankyrin repeat protein